MEIIALIGIFGGIIIYSSFSWGYVFLMFYNWFFLSVFPDVIHITFVQAVGLSMMTTFFKNHGVNNYVKDKDRETETSIMNLLAPWITLLCGFVVKLLLF